MVVAGPEVTGKVRQVLGLLFVIADPGQRELLHRHSARCYDRPAGLPKRLPKRLTTTHLRPRTIRRCDHATDPRLLPVPLQGKLTRRWLTVSLRPSSSTRCRRGLMPGLTAHEAAPLAHHERGLVESTDVVYGVAPLLSVAS